MKELLALLNNPSIITAIITICCTIFGIFFTWLDKLAQKNKNAKKILEAYKELYGRIDPALGSKIKELTSVSKIVELINEYKNKKNIEPQTKLEVKQEEQPTK